jgi:uridine kinase
MIVAQNTIRISEMALLSLAANQIWNISTIKSALGENTIVSICGGSCTGKSTQIAQGLLDIFEGHAQIISQDHFMLASMEKELVSDPYRWDHPDSFNLTDSAKIMDQLRGRFSWSMPVYSFRTHAYKELRQLVPTNIVLFEGLYAGYDFLRDHADYCIYVEMPLYARIVRRLLRNMYERYLRTDPRSILEGYLNAPLKSHQDFVIRQREEADIVIKVEYDFQEAIRKFNLKIQPGNTQSEKRSTVFEFISKDGLTIEIQYDGSDYFFVVKQVGAQYLNFQIGKSTYQKLLSLDLYSV